MTKAGKKLVTDNQQMNLFDLLKQDHEERAASRSGRLCCTARLHAAQRAAAKNAPKSREQLVDEMTDLLGITITLDQLNNWLAESHPHRMPAEYYPAFCVATGSNEPLRIMNEMTGIFTLPGPDALRAEIQKIEEDTRKLQKERQKRLVFLQELEKQP